MARDALKTCELCNGELGAGEGNPCRRCLNDPYPMDTELRREGFKIVARPIGKQALWQRKERLLPQQEAVMFISRKRGK